MRRRLFRTTPGVGSYLLAGLPDEATLAFVSGHTDFPILKVGPSIVHEMRRYDKARDEVIHSYPVCWALVRDRIEMYPAPHRSLDIVSR